jgi:tetratricopeptide (TPR) repeat protein
LDGRNGDAWRRLGMTFEELEEQENALAAFLRAVEAEPEQYRNHQALGNYWVGRARYGEAIGHFRRTVDLAPREPSTRFALAVAYALEGRYGEAEGELRKAASIRETPRVLNSLGSILIYQGRDREAAPQLVRAAAMEPENYLVWMNLGTANRRLKRAAEAGRCNRRALQLLERHLTGNPKDAYARACLAYVCAWTGARGRAQSEIAQALQISPGLSDVRRLAVKTYEALERREDSLAILRTAPPEVVADLGRYPDLADLHRDARFVSMLSSKGSR